MCCASSNLTDVENSDTNMKKINDDQLLNVAGISD
jgi:hypothetical protein